MKKLILTIGIFICSLSIFAQEFERSYYTWFDNQVGKHNTGLSNGTRYFESFRIYKGRHQFYLTSKYIKGDIIYFGQPYFDVDLKYDLFEDQIIVALIDEDTSSIIKLVKDQISSFRISDHYFVALQNGEIYNSSSNKLSGFFEVLLDDTRLKLIKKHRKEGHERIDDLTLYYQFKEVNDYYLLLGEIYYPIQKKSDWQKLFPLYKIEINSFYKVNKQLLKSDYDSFLIKMSLQANNKFVTQIKQQ